MAPRIMQVDTPKVTSDTLPKKTTVAIIGAGIVGLSAALTLAERGISVVVLEKGRVAGEQSSRNLGWIRKTNRASDDVPLSLRADYLWANMAERTGVDVGYRQAGILFLARNEAQSQLQSAWLNSVEGLDLGSRLLTPTEIDRLVPGGNSDWVSGLYTATDGRAEPTLAASAIAHAAQKKGVQIIEHCSVRGLSTERGRVSGVVTELGEIQCDEVLLAGGLWSRRFLGNQGIAYPMLPLLCSVCRTAPIDIPLETAVGADNFSFRKHINGGFIVTQRGKLDAPLTLDHLLVGLKYVHLLKGQRDALNINIGRYGWNDLLMKRRWQSSSVSPFEKVRTMDPSPNDSLNNDALRNLQAAWPQFKQASIEESWAGAIDITPDSNPVISRVDSLPGLTIASGFSGHGFGTSPAAGELAADLVTHQTPTIDPSPYRFNRF